jgi:hypothetical protein
MADDRDNADWRTVVDPARKTYWSDHMGQVVQDTEGMLFMSAAELEMMLTRSRISHVTVMTGDRYTIRELTIPHRQFRQIIPWRKAPELTF